MSLDTYITLGRSGLRVSSFCLGALTFGEDWGFGSSVQESQAVLARYLELGGNFLDTANIYTNGHSEKIIGDFLADDPSRRHRLVLATKFSANLSAFACDPNAGGASAKAIVQACEQSLRRLRTDYIDLYWMHVWDPLTPIEETMLALDRLVSSGKVRYLGFSDTPAWKVAQAQVMATLRGWSPLIALQIEYSLLERTVEAELIPMARELGLGVVPWSPLKGGLLSGKYTRAGRGDKHSARSDQHNARGDQHLAALVDRDFDLIDQLNALARQRHTSTAAIALAWVKDRPGVASTILGARTVKQLDENVKALSITLRPEEVARFDQLSTPTPTFSSRLATSALTFIHGGISVNGVTPPRSPRSPRDASQTY